MAPFLGVGVSPGPLGRLSLLLVPVLAIPVERLSPRAIDPMEAFIVAQIDGASTGEEIAYACGIPIDELLSKLTLLVERGIVALR